MRVITPRFRLSFPRLFTAAQIQGQGDFKYSLTAVFPNGRESITELMKAAQAVAIEKWGENIPNPNKFRWPFLTIEDLNQPLAGFEDGCVFIRCSTKSKPGVVDYNNRPVTDEEEAYAGRWAQASVNAYAWSHPTGGNGVSFGLGNVRLLDHGERIDGRPDPTKEFAGVDTPDGFVRPEDSDAPAGAGFEDML